jgi:GDP-mannose 6-dehydrogenase
MNIGVFGLGYVGIVNVACLSRAGHTIYCTDVKPQKVALVREGKSPILEPGVNELLEAGVRAGIIIASDEAREVVAACEMMLICVGTPSKQDGEVNLSYLRNVALEISSCLERGAKKFIVFRSTVPPGTTEALASEFFDRYPGVICAFYPEFLREGSAVSDFTEYGRFVLGVADAQKSAPLVNLLHVSKDKPSFVTDYRTAEYAKYIDNGFHALKVAFANEVFGLGASLGVNVSDAHAIFTADEKLNVSKQYLKPGMPFGGSCLPKDLRELQHLKKRSERKYPLLESIIPSNDHFLNYIVQQIRTHDLKRIGFIGVTFKNHSDDLRESPILRIISELERTSEFQIRVYDEDFNKTGIRIDFPSLYPKLEELDGCMENSDLLIVTKRYLQLVLSRKKAAQVVLNLSDLTTAAGADHIYNLYRPLA